MRRSLGGSARWRYDPYEERLFCEDAEGRHEVALSPQQHRLVAFMAERNRAAGDKPVLCGREELIQAVWGDEPDHTPQDLAYLVHQLRGRLAVAAPTCFVMAWTRPSTFGEAAPRRAALR